MRSRRTYRCVLSAALLATLTPSLAACRCSGGSKAGLDSVSVSGTDTLYFVVDIVGAA